MAAPVAPLAPRHHAAWSTGAFVPKADAQPLAMGCRYLTIPVGSSRPIPTVVRSGPTPVATAARDPAARSPHCRTRASIPHAPSYGRPGSHASLGTKATIGAAPLASTAPTWMALRPSTCDALATLMTRVPMRVLACGVANNERRSFVRPVRSTPPQRDNSSSVMDHLSPGLPGFVEQPSSHSGT